MIKLRGNNLLLGLLGGLSVYWGGGYFAPPPMVSQIISTVLLVFGGFAFVQNFGPAYRIICLGDRDQEWPGSHYGIVGKFLVAFGLVFSGSFRFYVNNFDDWGRWIGSLTSNFSSLVIAVGMAFMFVAPQVDERGFRVEGTLKLMIGIVVAFVLGCLVTSVALRGNDGIVQFVYSESLPKCPVDRPFWGSSRKVFHGPDSPYRAMISPSICFASEQEAIDNGYRKWRN